MKAARGQREANSQWKSKFSFRSRDLVFLKGRDAQRESLILLAGGVQSAGVAYVDKTWYSSLVLNCHGHLQQCLCSVVCQNVIFIYYTLGETFLNCLGSWLLIDI